MKAVLFWIFLVVVLAADFSSASIRQKRFYDAWQSNSDQSYPESGEPLRFYSFRQKSFKKEDPCANKPLWYLKYQARLGRLSPFFDCLSVLRI